MRCKSWPPGQSSWASFYTWSIINRAGHGWLQCPWPHHSSYVIPSGIAREAAWSLIAVLFLPASSIFHCIDAFMGTNTQIIGGKNNSLQMEDITHRYFLNKSFFPVCQALTLFPRVACPGWLPARKWTARWKLFCTRQPEEAQRWRCTPHRVLELQPKM